MKSIKDRSKRQEKRLEEEFEGKRTPASGALYGSPGDVMTKKLFIEAKTTKARQHTLKLDTLEKMEQQSFGSRKTPIMIVSFETARRDFVILSKEDFQLLTREEIT